MSNFNETTIICSRCRITRIWFDETQRGYNNVLIPLEYHTLKPHDCDISYPWRCIWCDTKCYSDRKITNSHGRLTVLEYDTDLPHHCPTKPEKQVERGYR